MSPTRFLLVLLLLGGPWALPSRVAYGQEASGPLPKGILPAAPATLLTCLPPNPTGWTVLQSSASNTFTKWLNTHADRSLKQDPPPPAPGAPPFVPGTIFIQIADSGFSSDYTPTFQTPKNGSLPSGVTLLKVGEFPARKQKLDETTNSLSILVKRRFLIEIRVRNVPDKDLMAYAATVNYPRLLAIPDTGPNKVPQPVVITKIDELDPKQNRSYPVYWSSGDQASQ